MQQKGVVVELIEELVKKQTCIGRKDQVGNKIGERGEQWRKLNR
jgi:hypothetical protein